MATKSKFSDNIKANIEALHDMGLKSPAIAAELGLSTSSVTGVVSHIVRSRRGYRKPANAPYESASKAKIVLVGGFSDERILSYVARFGASRIEVRP